MIPEEILGDIDRLLQLAEPTERARSAKIIRDKIATLPRFSNSAEAQYLWGFVAFVDPGRRTIPDLQRGCHDALRRALSIDPGHGRAWLYLGHLLLETQDFSEAQIAFTRAELHLGGVSMYLKVKAAEMRLVSTIRSDGIAGSLREFEHYAAIAEQAETEDIWPAELCGELEEAPKCDDGAIKELLVGFADRIDRAGKLGGWVRGALG